MQLRRATQPELYRTYLTVRAREHQPGKLLMHVDLHFSNGALGTLVMGTVQSRGTPMESI